MSEYDEIKECGIYGIYEVHPACTHDGKTIDGEYHIANSRTGNVRYGFWPLAEARKLAAELAEQEEDS